MLMDMLEITKTNALLLSLILLFSLFTLGCVSNEQITQVQKLFTKASENAGLDSQNTTVKTNQTKPPKQNHSQPPAPPPDQPPTPPIEQPPAEPTQQQLIQTLNETFMFPE
ncbi:hypothetical protein HY992_03165 [Candidatus Micrarchaeota archaeon]|nr:hypothetical protein [Candidatus Micrarchaeota archaeon]